MWTRLSSITVAAILAGLCLGCSTGRDSANPNSEGGSGMASATELDSKGLQGTWRLVSREKEGQPEPSDAIQGVTMTQTGNTFEFKGAASGSGATRGTFAVNATTNPKSMDRMPSDGSQQGKTLKGIYELNGDRLTLCVSAAGKDRPASFATSPGSGLVLSVFERER